VCVWGGGRGSANGVARYWYGDEAGGICWVGPKLGVKMREWVLLVGPLWVCLRRML
jgi:hypothetical protein